MSMSATMGQPGAPWVGPGTEEFVDFGEEVGEEVEVCGFGCGGVWMEIFVLFGGDVML